ncbi:MAG: hypothetical protein ACI8SR_000060 [Oceanicoccus sp.]|jgi:hypothetical protein
MSNHYHIVLHINKEVADNWSFNEVIGRSGDLTSKIAKPY